MMDLELHFVHGFLGGPGDWDSTLEATGLSDSVKVIRHNLLSDFLKVEKGSDPFLSWSRFKQKELKGSLSTKLFVGYSLGGRLLLHLDPRCFHGLILVASHPGLSEMRKDRETRDQWWAERIGTVPWETWLEQWNGQEIFRQDGVRPDRRSRETFKKEMGEILKFWSLGRQHSRNDFIKRYRKKIYWVYGKDDIKFRPLVGLMERLLPKSHIFGVPNSGHGVLFDNPGALGGKINEWIYAYMDTP